MDRFKKQGITRHILTKRFRRRVRLSLAVIYLVCLGYLVFFAPRRRHKVIRSITLTPLKSTLADYHNFAAYYPLKFYIDFFGNIFVFLPVCFAVKFLFPFARSWKVLLSGFLLSVSIEVLQYVFEVGYSEIDDVILNTLGTGLGIIIYKLISMRPLFRKRADR